MARGNSRVMVNKAFSIVVIVVVLGSVAELVFSYIVNAGANTTISANKTVGPLVTLFQVLIGLGFAIGGGLMVLEFATD